MKALHLLGFGIITVCCSQIAWGITVDLNSYQAQDGLTAVPQADNLIVAWDGADRLPLRLQLSIDSGVPTIKSAEFKSGQDWIAIAHNLQPRYNVSTGERRSGHGLDNDHRWDVYWDAPLVVPGPNRLRNPGLPRKPEEVGRYAAQFKATQCSVKTDGARLEINFPGVSMGIFAGDFRLTVYRGVNLVRAEVVAKTDSPSVAYIYQGGLSGFSLDDFDSVNWLDVDGKPQHYAFTRAPDDSPSPLIARNRVAVASGSHGSIATFPPPHIFFFAREVQNNLGYVWTQKDTARSFSLGVRQSETAGEYREDWNTQCWSLYNAPPGTWQRMATYFYLSPDSAAKCREQVMAFTRDDHYKPLPGYQTMTTHFHMAVTTELMAANNLDQKMEWIDLMRDMGLNIVYLCDFHADGHPNDPGPIRLKEQQTYFEIARRHSQKDFLIVPSEEPNVFLGGHYNLLSPKPFYWTHVRGQGQPFVENVAGYGRVYHTGSAADVFEMLKQEDAVVWQTHPRTKDSTGYPDRSKDTDYFKSDRFIGAGFKALPIDMSQKELAEVRAFGTLDDMNNWGNAKFLIGEVDTYKEYPEYDLWGDFNVNYVKLDELPKPDDFAPLENSLRKGDFFVSTGEVLIPKWSATRVGDNIEVTADVEWTFPLEFIEVVWGDGQKTDRKVISCTDRPAFGAEHFKIELPAAGKKWVRFSAWDSAVNGAFTQPVHFQ
jgi:hypothetical protein